MKKHRVIDLFAGVGGLSFGFNEIEEFEIVAANEILPVMAEAYELNHPGVKIYNEDIRDFNKEKVFKDLRISNKEEIEIIIGGPPCQAYSTVGKRLIEDPRGKLFKEYFRIIKEFKPRIFLYENVMGLLSMKKGELVKTIIELFKSLDYEVKLEVLNAVDYGVPQTRKRIIIVGTKGDKEFKYPEKTHFEDSENKLFDQKGKNRFITLGEAISDLPLIESGEERKEYSLKPQNQYQKKMREKTNCVLTEHFSTRNGQKMIDLMRALPVGGTPKDLPEELRPKSGFPNTYSRLWWDKPSTTITRNFSTPSSSRCIHPKCARPLTIREAARLQSFPDHFKFFGNTAAKRLQIGNAVPPLLSRELAKSVLEHLKKND